MLGEELTANLAWSSSDSILHVQTGDTHSSFLVHLLACSPVYGFSPAVVTFDLQVAETLNFLFAIATE